MIEAIVRRERRARLPPDRFFNTVKEHSLPDRCNLDINLNLGSSAATDKNHNDVTP